MNIFMSKKKIVGILLFFSLPWMGLSYLIFTSTHQRADVQIFGWISLFIGALPSSAALIMMFWNKPQVVISDLGIDDRRRGGFGHMLWSEIRSVRIGCVNLKKLLCIETENPEKFLANVSPMRRKLIGLGQSQGLSAISIDFSMLEPSVEKVIEHIRTQYPGKVK